MNTATQQVMFSSGKDDWETPYDVFDPLAREFELKVDAAATYENALCDIWYGPGSFISTDALNCKWLPGHNHWLNPPYSRCKEFIAKAAEESLKGVTTVCLIPSRTDTKMWHNFIWNGHYHAPYEGVEVRFIKGRIKFVGAKAGAPFPSAIVIFHGAK